MASNPIQIFRSTVASNTPALGTGATDNNIGYNAADGLFYWLDSGDVVQSLDLNIQGIDFSQPNDPALNTNPSAVGATFVNTVSGEVFIAIDVTTDLNKWIGQIDTTIQVTFQGTVSGYTSGGRDVSAIVNIIDKFSISSDANATDVGDLTQSRITNSGQSSSDFGYTSGGDTVGGTIGTHVDTIDKFSFASDANATDVGNLTVQRREPAGQSSTVSGYASGGQLVGSTSNVDVIDKFSFASDADATDVGDMTVTRDGVTGQTSTISGYTSGGVVSAVQTNVIDKFSFASDANATDVGDLTEAKRFVAGSSSTTFGYSAGALTTVTVNVIEKFSFSSDANSIDVADLTDTRGQGAGQSSTASGYISGGDNAGVVNIIEKYSFASDANSTDVGDLTVARRLVAGQQS